MSRAGRHTAAVLFLLLTLIPASGFAYRFLCNSINGLGFTKSDNCGSCTDANGNRWASPQVGIHVDLTTVPSGLTTAQWKMIVDTAFGEWNSVIGSSLTLSNLGSAPTRSYGEDNQYHQLFWLTTETQWSQMVGTNPATTLGITSTRFKCGSPRRIFDADLAMNGTENWIWGVYCKQGECRSALHTVIHELGHFVGMGHACRSCSWSMMSAKSTVSLQLLELQDDDKNGISVLYPAAPKPFGEACADGKHCQSGLCLTDGPDGFCTIGCENQSCPAGYACEVVSGQPVCGTGPTPICEVEGGSCANNCCQPGLSCAEYGGVQTCRRNCDPASPSCPGGQSCVSVGTGEAVCLPDPGANPGESCHDGDDCKIGLVCVSDGSLMGVCRHACTDQTQCPQGQRCLSAGACVPLGDLGPGMPCASTSDCRSGLLCIEDRATGSARCFGSCDGTGNCPTGQTCTAISGSRLCVPDDLSNQDDVIDITPIVGDGLSGSRQSAADCSTLTGARPDLLSTTLLLLLLLIFIRRRTNRQRSDERAR